MHDIRSFADFWPHYVKAHSRAGTRVLHLVGSLLAILWVVLGVAVSAWFLLAAPLIGYGFAWTAHFKVEHNRPATFGHPFYSLAADYVMVWKMITGSMDEEVRRHTGDGSAPTI